MNTDITTADRSTHWKIVSVALLWAIAVTAGSIFLR